MTTSHGKRGDLSRRDVLAFAGAGLGLAALGPLGARWMPEATGAPSADPILIVVNLLGGNDGLNMVIPTSLTRYYDRRETLAIAETDALALGGGPAPTTTYRLHPSFSNLAALWDQGEAAFVEKVGYPNANLSHFTSEDIYSYGVRGSFAPLGLSPSGWVARFADLYAPTPMGAASVGVGRRRDFVGGHTDSFLVDRLSSFAYKTDGAYRNDHVRRVEMLRSMLDRYPRTGPAGDAADALAQGYALADQVAAAVDAYAALGSTADYTGGTGTLRTIQRNLRDIATLVNFGFETRIFYTGYGGFDTHGNQGTTTGTQANLFSWLDGGIGGLATDLRAMGVWDRTAIVVISEFGRRTYINASGGTDHGHGNVFLLAGGAVRGGAYGPELTDADLDLEYLDYAVDFRDVYRSLLGEHLGVDPAPVFPEPQPVVTPVHVVG